MAVFAIGVDHRSAPVEIREALAFDPERARRFLSGVSAGLPERLLISTCNRTEVFAVPAAPGAESVKSLFELLRLTSGVDLPAMNGVALVMQGEDAIRHLFRVASGLESMVLGEAQILGQVKEAGEIAEACGATGPELRRLLESAVRVAKKVRTQTSIGEGAVSVASIAVDLARKVFGDLKERSALVVGAGETGALVARHLRSAGIGRLAVANRTLGRALEVAKEVGAEPRGLCGVPPAIREADIVVCSTAADEPILTYDEMKATMRARRGRMLLVLDIAVPRDVDRRAARLEGVFLHDIDAIGKIMDDNLGRRRKALPRAEAIVEDAVKSYLAWEAGLEVQPAIKALRDRFEEIRREELRKNLKRVPEEARDATVRLTESLVNRLLHEPTVRLRKAGSEPGGGKGLVAALREMFGFGEARDE